MSVCGILYVGYMRTIKMPMHSIMSSYTPDSKLNPNQNVVLIPVKGETLAMSNSDILDEGVMHIGEMRVLSYDAHSTPHQVGVDYPTPPKDMDDYLFQFYMGSLTVVGLLILFRFIQKT